MRRLLTLSGLLVGSLGIGIGLLLAVMRMQSRSIQVQQWHLTACTLPCLAGITIGQTTFDEAKQHLQESFGPIGYVEEARVTGDDGFYYLAWTRRNDDLRKSTSRINISFNNGVAADLLLGSYGMDREAMMPRLGEALLIFGLPTCFWIDSPVGDDAATLVYEKDRGTIRITTGTRAGMASPIRSISLDNDDSGVCKMRGAEWRSFLSRTSSR